MTELSPPAVAGANVAWLQLCVAGLLEAGWAVGLKYTQGFTRLVPSLAVAGMIGASMLLLARAARSLPIGAAYGVWVGIGTAGAAVLGVLLLGEPLSPARGFFLVLLLVAVAGLKITSAS